MTPDEFDELKTEVAHAGPEWTDALFAAGVPDDGDLPPHLKFDGYEVAEINQTSDIADDEIPF